ncbi:gamma-glutamyltransferase [Aetokthonos hydrillicola Thurmond2011]|jgi:gamma-glutamyltranspeptidase/glutathione hydrolase|uniref:Glutathione hydrolase proenzyme n=1 Tax=Aetokthonos hydrillicola Thurmond2011 TaxID=2712845 RepID=A0AAP5MD61_9CYAN|nr:gamma-glutamyltransferase [Aetokthonos hydrillicola]MBW4583925.1 gamma-glutamyltransferase [Aetokthonos hydrillicola CCALA 1050]MDR9898879.1 gamma-glutamyltransferase [Aetokthonos hydrillicola Thurmond2011]
MSKDNSTWPKLFNRYTRFSALVFYACFSVLLFGTQKITSANVVLPLRSKKGMVVSAHPLASDAGVAMLRKGGNAVDAAVATAFAISVVEPFSAGIGGGGFLLLHESKTGAIKALDFRERAPLKATRNMYLDAKGKVRPNASIDGYLAVATPGTVAGLYEVHRRYGKLSWQEVVKPAIALAQNGFILSQQPTWHSIEVFTKRKNALLQYPAARQIFTKNGELIRPGERLVQQDLAKTLTEISQNPQSFYTGNIARAIATDMAKNGGLITLEDLKSYKAVWRAPICGSFRQAKICSMPPPSSGGIVLLEILNIIGDTNLKSLGWHNPNALHLITEAMKIGYADRSEYLGDPDFVKVPVAQLLSPAYAKKRRQEIKMDKAQPSSEVKPVDKQTLMRFSQRDGGGRRVSRLPTRYESPETTHLNVVDEQHNAVSLTFTINQGFGSGVVTPGTGILLNDEMDDFAAAPGVPNGFGLVGNEANAIAPRKIPLSSMTPTIVTENNRLRMAVGAPGGGTIITQVLQVILNTLEYNMNVGAAVSVPRIHHQWLPDQLQVEPYGLDELTLKELEQRGHKIKETPPWGNINAIVVTPDGALEGAADPRGQGSPRSDE